MHEPLIRRNLIPERETLQPQPNALFFLDAETVRKEIVHQELKMWWVAEQSGIHVTTLRRWLSRRICQVRASHIEGLARVLDVPFVRIVL